MIADALPYLLAFSSTLVLTLLLTPVVREVNRKLGMVDRPDARRINRTPIPRGGGVALVVGVLVPYAVFHFVTGRPWIQGLNDAQAVKMFALAVSIAVLGLADDKFSLPPKIKLLGQVIIAFFVWSWAGLGFRVLWPSLPLWLDCIITVFWITGAVNAFNLIDGLDGLAAGISLIAIIGMAGGLFFIRNPQATLFYFALAGGLAGFLRYNYNPASVFLGDCGSMFLGFVVGTLPLASQVPNSFLVSVGVPLLAMGVPIFDTALAILRRSLRHLLLPGKESGGSELMTADSDHLHHRILRATGLNQRKAAWILYAIAAFCVLIGIVAMSLKSHAAGLWLGAFAILAVVVFKDSTIEMFDVGLFLNSVAHTHDDTSRKRMAALAVPFYVFFDIFALIAVFVLCTGAMNIDMDMHSIRSFLPIRVGSTFVMLVIFNTYRTVWSRALVSNYIRLLLACIFGSVAGSVFVYYWPTTSTPHLGAMTLAYAMASFTFLVVVRVFRNVVRDVFYAIDCSRLRNRKDVSRVLVYGSGLRYMAFRRELVRTTSANDRMIVGIIDDDVYLRGRFIGGIRIMGTINDAQEIINSTNADAVVIACEMTNEKLDAVKRILAPTGVKVSLFAFSETDV